MTLATLPDAIEWLRSNWHQQRPAPIRLHVRETEGLGPFYTAQFAAALDGSNDASTSAPATVPCYHPLLSAGVSPRDCPECLGLGLKEQRVDRYIYPMSRALARLSAALPPQRQPHPYYLVVLLADHGWNARLAASSVDINYDRAEALFLMAIRRLHGFYSAGPVSTRTSAGPTWIEKSDSQRAAETAA